jgi:hypothetical protein
MTLTPAGDVAKFLEARAAYRESMHPGDRALMSDVVAVQPLQAEITADVTVRTVELTEHHLRGVLRDLDAETERVRVATTRIQLARKTLIADGFFTEAEVGDNLAPRIRELLGILRCDLAETQAQLDAERIAAAKLSAEHARLRTTLGDALRAFTQRGRPGYEARRTHWVPAPAVAKWCETLAELTPLAVEVELPTVVIVGDEQIPGPAESP